MNLITNDNFAAEHEKTIDERTGDPKPAVAYYIERGDMKADTAWRYQPWGQFLVTAASLKLFGATTLAARLPFALAALASIGLFYWFVRKYFDNLLMASVATLMLVLNAYWILHGRQCRYYALSSLFMIITFISYALAMGSRPLRPPAVPPRRLVLVSGRLRNRLAGPRRPLPGRN